MTPGYVGADLRALVREAGVEAVRRIVHVSSMTPNPISPPDTGEVVPTGVEGNPEGGIACDAVASEDTLIDEPPEAVTPVHAQPSETVVSITSEEGLFAPASICVINMDDLLRAAKQVQPSATREGFAVAPDVTWADVGALAEVFSYGLSLHL